ncbi:MAG: TIGR03086 family metal-binding protein [Actinomycetota bacterium]|nr:TIGR03086 family metal-binding protein [Actinomycetota bacterium]
MSTPSQRYATAAARFTALVTDVPPPLWSAPSPCDGWSAADVVAHVVSTELDFMAQRGIAAPATDGLPPADAWPVVRDAMQAALDDPATATRGFDGFFGPTTVEATVDRFYSMDLIVHRWDLATATGLHAHAVLHPVEVEQVRENLVGLEGAMRSPGLFGPEQPVGPEATDQDRLLAYIGRATPP